MKRDLLKAFAIIAFMAGIFGYVSCQDSKSETPNTQDYIQGVNEYKAFLQDFSNQNTRSNEEELSTEDINLLILNSEQFLIDNDIDIENLGLDNNEAIILVAMSVLDYANCNQCQPNTRTTAGGCILQAIGIQDVAKNIAKGAAKQVAKATAKAVIKRAVPYVGWAAFAWEFIDCVTE